MDVLSMAADFSTYWGSLCALVESASGIEVRPFHKKPTDAQSAEPHQSNDAEHSHHKAGRDFCHDVDKDADPLEDGASGDSDASDHQPEGAVSDGDGYDRNGTAGEDTSGDTSKNVNSEAGGPSEEGSYVDEDADAREGEGEGEGEDEDEDEEEDDGNHAERDNPQDVQVTHVSVLGLGPPTTKTLVPVEKILVANWDKKYCEHSQHPDASAWLVKSTRQAAGYIVWTTPKQLEEMLKMHQEACRKNLVSLKKGGPGRFANGQYLRSLSCPILTCGGVHRPQRLYRAIYADMPCGGIRARGLDKTRVDTLFFQRHLQSHLVWKCLRPSPFISTASEMDRAVDFACMYEARGRRGIKLLVIDTDGEYWDHSESRLWDVQATMRRLGMAVTDRTRFEYLVEHSIPPDHIRIFDWDKVKERLDPDGRMREYWRARFERQEKPKRKREEEEDERPAKQRKTTNWTKDFDVKIQERM